MSLQRRTPLARGKPLARGRPPARRTRLRSRSVKTIDRDRYYYDLRAMWLPGRRCAAGGRLLGVRCQAIATDVHHTLGRGRTRMLDVDTWQALCRRCHDHVTTHPSSAYDLGLSHHRNGVPPPMTTTDNTQSCRGCGALMFWAKTTQSRSIPLIADPATRQPKPFDVGPRSGRVQETHREIGLFTDDAGGGREPGRVVVHVLAEGEQADPELPIWMSHFVDCPQSNQYRRGAAR